MRLFVNPKDHENAAQRRIVAQESYASKTGFLVARAVALRISINTNGRPNPNQSLSLGLSGWPR